MLYLCSVVLLSLGMCLASEHSDVTCQVARTKCSYRQGCGMALHNYMIGCADLMAGKTKNCQYHCKKALIALTSTDEGKQLMKCKCEDELCALSKSRIEVCRHDVFDAIHSSANVSCTVAQWICDADPPCSTALDYYHELCRAMMNGRKCTHRCKNSISILLRLEKASKLSTCHCDGTEKYDCLGVKQNMHRLCYARRKNKNRPQHRTRGKSRTRPHKFHKAKVNKTVMHKKGSEESGGVVLTGVLVTTVFTTGLNLLHTWIRKKFK